MFDTSWRSKVNSCVKAGGQIVPKFLIAEVDDPAILTRVDLHGIIVLSEKWPGSSPGPVVYSFSRPLRVSA